jgi:dUTP pyrophosphatase
MSKVSPTKRARVAAAALPPAIVGNLSKLQSALNAFINKDWVQVRKADDWGLAITMESTELLDSYPWKWWKNVNAVPDFKNVRVELVDILHFSLSGTMQVNAMVPPQAPVAVPAAVLTAIAAPLAETPNAIATFRSVIDLARLHQFETISEMVIAAADDLDFNIVAYYVAKHTLNYIRQLGGYKTGDYVKVNKGMEDNEMLHACIAGVTFEHATGDATFEAVWDDIMVKVYDSFAIAAAERRNVKHWVQ